MRLFRNIKKLGWSRAAIFCLAPAFLFAQADEPKWAFRADLDGLFRQKAAFSIEKRFKKRGGLELEFFAHGHQKPGAASFSTGSFAVKFEDEKVDSVRFPGALLVNVPTWRFVGPGRPFESVGATAAVWTRGGRLGWRFRFRTKSGRGEWAIEPTLAVAAHRFWTIDDRLEQRKNEVKQQILQLPVAGQIHVRTERRGFEQTRTVGQKTVVVPGIFYQIGRMERLTPRFFIEARAGGGLNFSPPELEKAPPPSGLFYADFSLKIGLVLDGCVDDLPAKKRREKPKPRVVETL